MRRSPWLLLALGVLCSGLLGGCATVPATLPIADQEGQQVAALFQQTIAAQRQCGTGLDVQVRVNLRSIWQNGSLQGFVQALAPSHLKFVGVNPLGQPMLILATDGATFRAIVVPAATWYEGSVEAADFRKYAPAGFDPSRGFFWLTGRLAPEGLRIEGVEQDKEGGGQWLTVSYPGTPARQRVLFDPQERLIRRHLVVDDAGKPLVDMRYDNYLPNNPAQDPSCRLPGVIRIESAAHSSASMEIELGDWLDESTFTPLDFNVPVPPGFVQKPIE